MIGLIILLFTLCLLVLNYIDSKNEFKFLSDNRRKFFIRNKKIFALIFSSLIALMVCIDSFFNDSRINALHDGQNAILEEIVLTDRKKDSIVNHYTAKLEVKGEELMLAQTAIRKLLGQLDYYNKSTDEVIKESYNLFLKGEFEEAIALLEVYVESATEKRLIRIYKLKMDLLKAQAKFSEALNYSEKLFYLRSNQKTKFEYAELLFLNGKMVKSKKYFIELHEELEEEPGFLENLDVVSLELFQLYYYIGRISAYSGDHDSAISSYYRADQYLKKYEGERNYYTLSLMNAIGISLYLAKEYKIAEEVLTDLINNFRKYDCSNSGCNSLKSTAYANLSNVVRVGREDYRLALKYLEISEDIYFEIYTIPESEESLYQLITLKFNKGMTYKGLQEFNESEQIFLDLINSIPEKRNHLHHKFMISELTAYFQLADLYMLMKNNEKAVKNFNKSLQLIENHKREHQLSSTLIELKSEIEDALSKL